MKATLKLTAFIAAIGAIFAFAAPAQAQRGVVGHFGEAGSGDGQIGYAYGVAVNGTTGDVYVADLNNPRVEHFDTDGNFLGAFGWGVADGAEEAEVCTSGCLSGNPGAGGGQFSASGTHGVAVSEADGSVYVVDTYNYRIEKFDAEGNFELAFGWGVADGAEELQSCTSSCQSGLSGHGGGQLNGSLYTPRIVVDPTSGDILLADPENSRVQEFSSGGHFVRTFGRDVEEGGGEGFEVCTEAAKCKPGQSGEEVGAFPGYAPQGLGVDSAGNLYTVDSRVQKFTPSGGSLEAHLLTLSPEPGPISDLTIDRSTGDIVVVDQNPTTYFMRAQEFDPAGNLVDQYLGGAKSYSIPSIAFDPVSGRGYAVAGEHAIYILGPLTTPEVTIAPATEVTATGATLNGSVNSQGEPGAHYHFEYSLEGSGEWLSTSDGTVPGDSSDHAVSAPLAPPGGLEPNSTYLARLVAEKPENEPVTSGEISFSTGGTAPIVETVGSPFRTATTARLDARVNARGAATTYSFEYGPTAAYGSSAPAEGGADAGSSQRSILVSQQVTGLEAGNTYHYRVLATNAFGTTAGDDMTVTTRADDQPLTHGHFPGPPGSDRAWEQVSLPDTGGNPIFAGYAFSDDGNRAVYQVTGGTPQSDNGTLMNQFFAERTADGWETSSIWPTRADSTGSSWFEPAGNDSLTKLMAQNVSPGASEWFLTPGAAPKKIVDVPDENYGYFYEVNEEISRVIVRMKGTVDPAYPMEESEYQFYDVTSGTPHLISLMPDGSVPSCGVPMDGSSANLPNNQPRRITHWISADGNRVFFPSVGTASDCEFNDRQLYMRDLEAEETVEISGPPVSGPECTPTLIKTNEDSAFFWSQSRLVAEDTEPDVAKEECSTWYPQGNDGDIYRYDFASGQISCLTCHLGRVDVQTSSNGFGGAAAIAMAADGSRVYFTSPRRLIAGEGMPGGQNVYRLDVASGTLKFVSPAGRVGDITYENEAMTPDGSVIVFTSESPLMNAITGSDNHGTLQYYRYDDRDGSLVCVSCPRDGTPPGELSAMLTNGQIGPNTTPLSADGTFVFITSAPLVGADQNTSKPDQPPALGKDVYEWRDGRVLLISDGETTWPSPYFNTPGVAGITPSGRDVYFTVSTQLTPDAIDGFKRLYDARIGGGFDFPAPEPPCPLEICQGEAKGAPNDPTPASDEFRGAGNAQLPRKHRRHKKCHRGKKKRCAKKHPKKHASTNGRAH